MTATITAPEATDGSAVSERMRRYACDPETASYELRAPRHEILVEDGGVSLRFRLQRRGKTDRTWGWTCDCHDLVAGTRAQLVHCPTAEPYAVMREYGPAAETLVLQAMRPVIRELVKSDEKEVRRRGRHLVAELREAVELKRVGVARFHSLILEALESGRTTASLAVAAGFVNGRDDRPDTSWFVRRIGLGPTNEVKNGKRRVTRTVDYDNAVRYCRALHLDPWEMGL